MALSICAHGSYAFAQEREGGRPFLQNFALRDYHAHNQNWAAVQDADGILYFGNKNVVLEYDGVAWKKITIDRTTYVRGLAIEPGSGKIFVGGVDELGYYEAEPRGEQHYVSLLGKLPPEAHDFRDIRRVFATSRGIFFVADQLVMRWRDGAFKIWKLPNASRLQSFWAADQLYVQQPEVGLLRLQDDSFSSVSPDPVLRTSQITFLAASGDGSLTAGTYDNGLFTLRNGALAPLVTEVDPFLKEKKIRRGLILRDGSMALATASSGLVVLDPDRRMRNRVDESVDLQNDTILDLFQDREGVLWLCLNSGITRVEIASPLSIFDAANGLRRTTARDILRHKGVLYFAAADGIYRLLPADPAKGQMARGERIRDTENEWWSLCSHHSGLLVSGIDGVVQLDDTGAARKIAGPFLGLVLRASRIDPERVFVGTRHGLRSIRRDPTGAWADEGLIPGADVEVRTIVETPSGEVWLGTPISGIFRVRFGPSPPGTRGTATVDRFYESDGLPRGQHWTRVIQTRDGEALFATQAGLYRFDNATRRFQPVDEFAPRFADGSFMFGSSAEDAAGDLWLAGRSPVGAWPDQELGRAFARKNNAAMPFEVLPYKIADKVGEIEKFYPEEDRAEKVVWIGGTEGAVRVQMDRLADIRNAPSFATVIRRATTTDAETAGPRPITNASLPHSNNSVHFEFAGTTYAIGPSVRYQTRLRGFEQGKWSDFSERPNIDYTNLPAGSYTFEVRARDANGRLGTTASLPFYISPPWQRTYAAYGAYAIFLLTSVFAVVRWQLDRFQRKHAMLEAVVAARTAELRAREAELVSAKDAADSANRAKSAFLANMSHELRTPLNAILGYTQILLKDDAQSARNRERLTVVDQSGNHLLAMINEVLDLSKIEAGKLNVNPTEFSLGELIEDICAAFRQRVSEKGLDFDCDCPDELKHTVRGDAGKLRQVLFNLLGNAVKFTDRGGVSLVLTSLGADRVRFVVRDTGIGIAPEELRDIFLTFRQSTKTAASAQGTGLGLAISERLVELLGGHLEVESVLGKGSSFHFDLELPAVATGEEMSTSPAREKLGKVSPIAFQGPARRILIVDDETTNRDVLRELLAPLGFEIAEAINGVECLEHCMRRPPDALLVDLQMAPIDGFEVTRQLRERPATRGLKIIAVSASVFEDDQQHAIRAGCDDFLPKPFTEEQLLDVLGRALELQWTFPETTQRAEPDAGSTGVTPPLEEIDSILELSRKGDILGIKKRLATLGTIQDGTYAAFVASLQPFVAAYQMDRIRDALLKLKNEQPA
jgi:signal transduction histidine kinase/CheY-like chemotaxis protein/ligand-binding sensor domain-containing protein